MRTLRFVEGEPAIIARPSNIPQHNVYVGTPCHVVERGPMAHPRNFRDIWDYIVAMCDGKQIYINDEYLKKIEPPADDVADTEEVSEELEHV
jgi:hypothetical protein